MPRSGGVRLAPLAAAARWSVLRTLLLTHILLLRLPLAAVLVPPLQIDDIVPVR